ncbi:ZIP family metal transporter [Halalkalicoccus jeotgali]|uniref:Zinc/iron permease n=1 Tax=Halalkalicoccus jeotgali (strain DSM 18796 / CECT 7217 / JCM 14584 / KCTC 4019 / B3) TaxID=795797 RepID=D8J638_HALJB|nr:ZIP family metal transporter [Halalkalicoccus jeotgali]ADJ15756.1 zinc/iron permease [Halalkalicoccus jeotgali B3]ELY37220.1 zinc/iron permease [Halalkalicoccus jeotgali B3]
MEPVLTVLLVSLLAGCATGLGALPILVVSTISHRVYDAALGLAAGIMFGAAVFALIVPGMEGESLGEVLVGVLLGGLFLLVANRAIPHFHMLINGRRTGERDVEIEPEDADTVRRALLVGGSITLHNVPEGLAVGIAFGSGLEGVGFSLALAIAIQNVPDGFAMAVPASRTDLSDARTILYTTLSGGIPEPIAALAGFVLVAVFTQLFPVAAGFAAGTMMAVIFREMIPQSHGHGYADEATLLFIFGFSIMLFVDTVLAV